MSKRPVRRGAPKLPVLLGLVILSALIFASLRPDDSLGRGVLHAGRQPGSLDVEGEESVARKSLFEAIERGGDEPFEGSHTQANFSYYYFKVKLSLPLVKITMRVSVEKAVLGVT